MKEHNVPVLIQKSWDLLTRRNFTVEYIPCTNQEHEEAGTIMLMLGNSSRKTYTNTVWSGISAGINVNMDKNQQDSHTNIGILDFHGIE